MSDSARMQRARRDARTLGYLLSKDGDTVDVIECSIHGSDCRVSRNEIAARHWRSHVEVYSGNLDEVESWLSAVDEAAGGDVA